MPRSKTPVDPDDSTEYILLERQQQMTAQQKQLLAGILNRYGDEPEPIDPLLDKFARQEGARVISGRPMAEAHNLQFFGVDFTLRSIERAMSNLNDMGQQLACEVVFILTKPDQPLRTPRELMEWLKVRNAPQA